METATDATAKDQHDSTRDLILSIVAYACLYWFVVSVVWLSFSVVDYLVPDPLTETYNYYGDTVTYVVSPDLLASTLVSAIAAILLMRLARRARTIEVGSKFARTVSRVLLYGSLAAVFVVLAVDLVYALRGFFAADLPANAALKALLVAAYSALSGWYLLSLRPGFSAKKSALRGNILSLIVAALTLALVITGALANNRDGSSLRDLRTDARRVEDLKTLQTFIVSNWDLEKGPASSLAELEDVFGLTLPRDPETGAEYGYRATATEPVRAGDLPRYTFTLCANFTASSSQTVSAYGNSSGYGFSKNFLEGNERILLDMPDYGWSHAAGEVCFDRAPKFTRYDN